MNTHCYWKSFLILESDDETFHEWSQELKKESEASLPTEEPEGDDDEHDGDDGERML